MDACTCDERLVCLCVFGEYVGIAGVGWCFVCDCPIDPTSLYHATFHLTPLPFSQQDITRVLTTILVATTACTIYSAALFTNLATELLGARGVSVFAVAVVFSFRGT